MTRQQALEKAANERAATKDSAVVAGPLIAPVRERTEAQLKPAARREDASPFLSEPVAALSRFADAFSALLDTIRESDQYGPTLDLRTKFDVLREELSGEYPGLRGTLAPHVESLEPRQSLGFDFHGLWSDPFEALIGPESLTDLLEQPVARTARDVIRAVNALERCWHAASGHAPEATPCG